MKRNIKIIIIALLSLLSLLAWAPWLDNQAIHDRVFQEKAHKDGTIQPVENIGGNEEVLQSLIEESRKRGIVDGILICDYNVMWFPFGRYVASCEGGYYVNFYGKIVP